MKNLKITLGVVTLSLALVVTGCKGKDEELDKEDINNTVEQEEEEVEENKEADEDKENEDSEKNSKEEEKETIFRALDVYDRIAEENFEGKVKLEDYQIVTEISDASKVNFADFYLYLDVEDKEEAEELIEKYSQIFEEEFNKTEEAEEVILIWTTPINDEKIEKILY